MESILPRDLRARLEGLAEAGGICISGSAYEQIENKLPLSYEYLGKHNVKNIRKPVHVYRALLEFESASAAAKIRRVKFTKRHWIGITTGAIIALGAVAFAIWENYSPPPTNITIGTGSPLGIYYPTGGVIARILNKKRDIYGIRCTVESTSGSVFNINAVMTGDLEFGIAQSDRQYQAWNGLAEWRDKGPQKELRAVFSIHYEPVTLIAADDAGISSIHDLRGKRVNIGKPRTGQRLMSLIALNNAGIDYKSDLEWLGEDVRDAIELLKNDQLDAIFITTAHPSRTILEATTGVRKVRFIPITDIESLLRKYPFLAKSFIPIKFYPSSTSRSDIQTFGLKATLITSSDVSESVVYAITKEIFDNFEAFKRLHPAYEYLTRESLLSAISAPIHEGAMRYYTEKGFR
jgi:TRAP transporter TAXI family solute receptor